ncbi:MAG: hypothetical protein F4Z31_06025 [Gemmatimonadetes bacterium]|nr:hypothetical protein [Gemmatimonadota bacterium]
MAARHGLGLSRDQARAVVREVLGGRGKLGILHRAVKEGRTVRIEGMFRIRTKKREPYAKRLPSGRVVAVRGKLEPKITASPGFKDYISAFGTAPPE